MASRTDGPLIACTAAAHLVIACQTSHARIEAPRLARGTTPTSTIDPQGAAATLARLRGIAYDQPMGVHVLDGRAFLERFHAGDAGRSVDGLPPNFWAAFHFAADGGGVTYAQGLAVNDALLGFYDLRTDELFIRRGRASAFDERFAIAHEVAHGIQHRLGVVPWRSATTDEHLARRALVEGDANLMAAAYMAVEAHREIGVSVARIRDRVGGMSVGDLARFHQLPASIANAPPLVRARMFFPYVEGTAFATALYQSGGMALINAALAHPPVSTEQVLHPEKYLAGELPIPVSTPFPVGGTMVDHGTLGELQTAVYLAQCMDERSARRTAEGWGGDAYTVILEKDGNPTVLWSTAWDTPQAAARFEAALGARQGCTAAGRAPRTLRRGASVAVIEAPLGKNYDPEDLIARVPSAPAATPPVGKVVLRLIPPPESQFLHKGQITGDTFASDRLGIVAAVPSGFDAELPREGAEVSFRGRSRVGSIFFLFDPVTADFERNLAENLGRHLPEAKDSEVTQQAYVIRLPIGLADVEQVRTTGAELLLAAFVPVCDGEATLVLVSASVPRQLGEGPVDAWFDDVKVAKQSPACDYLHALAANPGEHR